MLRNKYKDNFISVEPLTVKVCMLNDATLDSSFVCMTMTEMTLRRIFDGCNVQMIIARLVDTINVKYMQFSNIAFENIIRDSNIFNEHQLIDCELLALIFNMYEKK